MNQLNKKLTKMQLLNFLFTIAICIIVISGLTYLVKVATMPTPELEDIVYKLKPYIDFFLDNIEPRLIFICSALIVIFLELTLIEYILGKQDKKRREEE